MNGLKNHKPTVPAWAVGLVIFVLLFVYSTLNMQTVNYGYRLQELRQKEKELREEIDRLTAVKAQLESLERVQRIASATLGFDFPAPDQIVRVQEVSDAN